MTVAAYRTKKYTRSVADFLSANRCAGRYVLGVAEGIAAMGAISIVGLFEAYYSAGPAFTWWSIRPKNSNVPSGSQQAKSPVR